MKKESKVQLSLSEEKLEIVKGFEKIRAVVAAVDNSLVDHVNALCTQALHRVESLEKKMLKAEKKKFEARQRQIKKMKTVLFPGNVLQERKNNILEYLSIHGTEFLQMLYEHSPALTIDFTVITEK